MHHGKNQSFSVNLPHFSSSSSILSSSSSCSPNNSSDTVLPSKLRDSSESCSEQLSTFSSTWKTISKNIQKMHSVRGRSREMLRQCGLFISCRQSQNYIWSPVLFVGLEAHNQWCSSEVEVQCSVSVSLLQKISHNVSNAAKWDQHLYQHEQIGPKASDTRPLAHCIYAEQQHQLMMSKLS